MVLVVVSWIVGDPDSAFAPLILKEVIVAVEGIDEGIGLTDESDQEGPA